MKKPPKTYNKKHHISFILNASFPTVNTSKNVIYNSPPPFKSSKVIHNNVTYHRFNNTEVSLHSDLPL